MNVLVTGGAGYIGSHTCKELKKRGHNPVTFDNLVYGHEWAVKWGPFYKGDLHETPKLEEIIRKENIEAVIHFAAFAYVGESMRDPLKYYENNLAGTLSLLRAVRTTGLKKFVFSSSCATYGIPPEVPIRETTAQAPINPYGRTKLMIEKVLKDLESATGLSSICLRYFNAAGADPELEIGEDHNPETHLIPLAIAATDAHAAPLTIFGDDYPTPDGTCIRDYIHVCDLANAHVLALESLNGAKLNGAISSAAKSASANWQAFNLGTGHGYSVKQVVEALNSLLQKETPKNKTPKKVQVKWGARRPGDPAELVAQVKEAKSQLGWTPQYSSLETILQTAWDWSQKGKS